MTWRLFVRFAVFGGSQQRPNNHESIRVGLTQKHMNTIM
jgi:hypothetical protein